MNRCNNILSPALMLCLGVAIQCGYADPLPSGAQVVHGKVDIATHRRNMHINQSTSHGIINWNSFSIGQGYGVHINNGAGATLNRVTGTDISSINGSLTGTGSIYLLNKNGIIFGEDGSVLTGGDFVASTHNITDANFLSGGPLIFHDANSNGTIENLGQISSLGGDVILAGYKVSNLGNIDADEGRIGLLSGGEINILSDTSWSNGAFSVSLGEFGGEVRNEGQLKAKAIELRANNGNIYALAGNTEGSIHATGIASEDGMVFLTAEDGVVQSSGEIIATRGDDGGDIIIEADVIENYGGVQDVSGDTGGSIILTAGEIISDTQMLARGHAGDGGAISLDAKHEVLLTSAGAMSVDGKRRGGEILVNSHDGRMMFSADVSATGGTEGGWVNMVGIQLSLLGGSIQADGGHQGGVINVGGGYQGGVISSGILTPDDYENSRSVYVSETSILSADGGRNDAQKGHGGEVVIWSDGTTQFAGSISTVGGDQGGDGGIIETSGLEALGIAEEAVANASAAKGQAGTWLLDPRDITISDVSDPISEFQRVAGTLTGATLTSNIESFGQRLDVDGDTAVVLGHGTSGGAFVYEDGEFAARLSGDFNFGQGISNLAIEEDVIALVSSHARSEANPSVQNPGYIGVIKFYRRGEGWQNGTANFVAESSSRTRLLEVNCGGACNYNGSHHYGRQVIAGANDNSTVRYFYVSDPGYDSSTTYEDQGRIYRYYLLDSNFVGVQSYTPNRVLDAQFGHNMAVGDYNTVYAYYGTGASALWIRHANNEAVVNYHNYYSITDAAADGNRLVVTRNSYDIEVADFDFSELESHDRVSYSRSTPIRIFNQNRHPLAPDHRFLDVAISGDTIVAGALSINPSTSWGSVAMIFVEPEAGWSSCNFDCQFDSWIPDTSYRDSDFGGQVAIDGNTILVGADNGLGLTGSTETGQALLVYRNEDTGRWFKGEQVDLFPASPNTLTNYGKSVAVDGDTFIVTDPYRSDWRRTSGYRMGALYVYESGELAALIRPDSTAIPITNNYFFGWDADISNDTIATINHDGNSRSRIFILDKGTGWQNGLGNLRYSIANSDSRLEANSIAIDNNVWAVGYEGSDFAEVHVYENSRSNPTILSDGGLFSGLRGTVLPEVDISGDSIVMGAYSTSSGFSARLQVFDKGTSWSDATTTLLSRGDYAALDDDIVTHFGQSVAIDADTIVAGFDPLGDQDHRSAYIFERADGASAWLPTPVARLDVGQNNFGNSVAIDGDTVAVGSFRSTSNDLFDAIYVFEKQGSWQDGDANLVASLVDDADNLRGFGYDIAIDGDYLISSGAGASTTSDYMFAFAYEGPFDLNSRAVFSANPTDNLNYSATQLANTLSFGTNITLQAHRNITVLDAILVDNPDGDGGSLTLQAGRNVLVNASIDTDNADLTLIANDASADPTYRGAGEGRVVIGRDAANESVKLTTGTADILISAGDRFENRSGDDRPFVFNETDPGRWLVFSDTPDQTGALDTTNLGSDLNVLGRDFLVYNMDFNAADPAPASLPQGSGFIYRKNPVLTVSTSDDAISYGGLFGTTFTLDDVTVDSVSVDAATYGLTNLDLDNVVAAQLAGGVDSSAAGHANVGVHVDAISVGAKSTVTAGGIYGLDAIAGTLGDLTVTQALLTVTPEDASRSYGDDNPDFLLGYEGFAEGEDSSVLGSAPTASTDALANTDVGTATITASGGTAGNYSFAYQSGTLTITQRDLVVTGVSAVDRAYDTTDVALLTGTAAIAALDGDDVVLGGTLTAFGRFDDKNAGEHKTVTVAPDATGYVITGDDANNYNLIQPLNLKATINPFELSVSGLSAEERVYDATTIATVTGNGTIDPFDGDDVLLQGAASGLFADKNVGTDKIVTVTDLLLGGADAANYAIAELSLTADVTPATIALTGITINDKIYDASTSATIAGTATVNALASDVLAVSGSPTAAFADRHAGEDKAVSVAGYELSGADADNYQLALPENLTANISALDIAPMGIGSTDRVYDGTTQANLTGDAAINTFEVDDVALNGAAIGNYLDRHAGTDKTVFVSGLSLSGANAGNYNLVSPAGLSSSVTPMSLDVTGLSVDIKVYDRTTAATVTGSAEFADVFADDDVTFDLTGATYAFNDRHVGTGKPVELAGLVINGAHAGNYLATGVEGLSGDITPKSVTIADVTAADKIYDATTLAALSDGSLEGVITGDTVTLDGEARDGQFDNKNVGADKSVTASGFVIAGADAGNYELNQPQGVTASITARDIQLTGLSADNKVYDATTDATLSGDATVDPLADDVLHVGITGTASFADKNVAEGIAVTVIGYGLTGTDAGNYNLLMPTGLEASITQKLLTAEGLVISDKVYDGTTAAEIFTIGEFGGILGDDEVNIDVGSLTATFIDKNAGEDKLINFAGISLTGSDANNYTAGELSGITATITPLAVTINGVTAADKIYDATTVAALVGGSLVGALTDDDVALNADNRSGAFPDKHVGVDKSVTASGYVLTGSDAQNYALSQPTGLAATISVKDVELAGLTADDKIYDRTTDASLSGDAAIASFEGDDVQVGVTGSASFADFNVADDITVTVIGYALTGSDADNYNLWIPDDYSASITPKLIESTGLTIANKVYDGTTVAELSGAGSFGGVLGDDDVQINVGTLDASFADKNVGTNKLISFTGVSLTGEDAGNYTAAALTGVTANITPLAVTINGVSAADKVYDATRVATLSGGELIGALSDDEVTLSDSGRQGEFEDKNVGEDKVVTASGYVLTGDDAQNYALSQPTGLTASISPATVTVTGINGDKIYDGLTSTGLGSPELVGILASDQLELDGSSVQASFDNRLAEADKTLNLDGDFALTGTDSNNYIVDQPTDLTATIAKKTVSSQDLVIADKVYDGNTVATVDTAGSISGLVGNDVALIDLNALVANFSDRNVGEDKPIEFAGLALAGADAVNYEITPLTGITASITARLLDITGIVVDDKTYDATVAATFTGGALANLVEGDQVALADDNASARFADKNAGQNKTVSVIGFVINGEDAGNYLLSQPAGLTATINVKDLQLSGLSADDKVYDATTVAALSGEASINPIAGDELTVGVQGTAAFDNKNVGEGKPVTVTGYELTGTDATNYNLLMPTDLAASVTQAELLLTGVVANDRVYDATTVATLAGDATVDPLLDDQLSIEGELVASFDDKHVGIDKAVTLAGVTIGGVDAGNYLLLLPQDLIASIAPADLALTGLVANDRVYDGGTLVPLSGAPVITPLMDDSVSLAGIPSANFNDKNAGEDKRVTVNGYSLTGTDADNYNLQFPSNLTATVSQRELAVSGIAAVDRVYNGTVAVDLTGTPGFDGLVTGDDVLLTIVDVAGSFEDKNVGVDKAVALQTTGLEGADAGNYTVVLPGDLSATVTSKTIETIGIDAQDKVYDGATDTEVIAESAALAGVINGDAVALDTSDATADFVTPDADTDKPVVFAGVGLTGLDALNYELVQPGYVLADVTQRLVTIAGLQVADKFEDGTTTATISGGRLDDIVPGDEVRIIQADVTANFEDGLAGEAKDVFIDGFGIAGPDAANYQLASIQQTTGNIFRQIIVDQVVPPDVLRAQAEEEAAERIDQIVELFSGRPDPLAVPDPVSLVAGIPSTSAPEIIQGIVELPANQLSGYAQQYIAASEVADAAYATYEAEVAEQNKNIEHLVSTTKAYNRTSKQLDVARETARTYVNQRDEFESQLTAVEADLEQVALAERRIQQLERDLANAASLGRGAEVEALQAMIDDLGEVVAQKEALEQQRDGLAELVEETKAKLDESIAEINELRERKQTYEARIDSLESSVDNGEKRIANAKAEVDAAKEDMEEARSAQVAFFKDSAENYEAALESWTQKAARMDNVANSDFAERTANDLVTQLPIVQQSEAQLLQVNESVDVMGDTISSSLGAGAKQLADQLVAEAAAGNLRSPEAFEAGLIESSPSLKAIDTEVNELIASQEEAKAKLAKVFDNTLPGNATGFMKTINDEVAKNDQERLSNLLTELSGINLDEVPTTDENGNALSDIERIALGMNNKAKADSVDLMNADNSVTDVLGDGPGDTANNVAAIGVSGVNRVDDQLGYAAGLGVNPSDIAKDPSLIADISGKRSPVTFDSNGNPTVDPQQAVTNSQDMAVAYIKSTGAVDDAITAEAENADKTGTLRAVNQVKGIADEELAEFLGGSPDELAIQAIQDPVDFAGKTAEKAGQILSSPENTVDFAKEAGQAAIAAAEKTVDAAFDKLEEAAGPLGVVVEAGKEVYDLGKDLVNAAGSLVGLDSGPTAEERAYARAQEAYNEAMQAKRETEAVIAYLTLASEIANKQNQLDAAVDNAKAQVGAYVVTSKMSSELTEQHSTIVDASKTVMKAQIQADLESQAEQAANTVERFGEGKESLEANVALWGG